MRVIVAGAPEHLSAGGYREGEMPVTHAASGRAALVIGAIAGVIATTTDVAPTGHPLAEPTRCSSGLVSG